MQVSPTPDSSTQNPIDSIASISVNPHFKDQLEKHLNSSIHEYDRLKRLNQRLGIGLGLLGILLSLGASVSGVFGVAKIAAIFGACASTTQAILFAYPLDKRAAAYRVFSTRTKNLSIDLELREDTQHQLHQLLEEFKAVRLEAASEEANAGSLEETIAQLKRLIEEYDKSSKKE